MAVNKVVYGATVLVDLTGDTVSASDLAEGITAHSANGELVTGNLKENNLHSDSTTVDKYITASNNYVKLSGEAKNDTIIRQGTVYSLLAKQSEFGDALASDVAKGKTFTSADGFKITGKMESGGLDTSDATATATDIRYNKTAYVKGEKITGDLRDAGNLAFSTFSKIKDYPSSNCIYVCGTRGSSSNSVCTNTTLGEAKAPYSEFGDATAEDVAKGKTFTSASGLKVTGTHECSSGGDSTLNCEMQTISNVTSPKVTFNGTGGTYKVYGYGKGTSSGYMTPKYAFAGNKYYTISSWGNDTTNTLNITVDSSGNISGLPSLTSGELVIVRVPS